MNPLLAITPEAADQIGGAIVGTLAAFCLFAYVFRKKRRAKRARSFHL
jgi:hypothetical protein